MVSSFSWYTGTMIKDLKLVVCDIDDTLVVRHNLLTPRAKRMIKTLKEKNIYFGLASGRPLYDLDHMMEKWHIEPADMLIGMNGSSLRDTVHQKEYTYYLMKPEWIKETIEIMKQFHANPIIYEDDTIVCVKRDTTVISSALSGHRSIHKVDDIAYLYQKENAKIMFRIKANQMEEVESYFQAHPSPNYIGFKTQPTLFEFTNIHTDKGYALRQYCEINGLSPEQVMAFGDTSNDNGMLEYSGLGVCLKNGSEDTKAIADVVTDRPCTMDGWADFMEKYFDRRQQDGE